MVLGAKWLGASTDQITMIPEFKSILPTLSIPEVPFNLKTLEIIFPYAVIMASVGLIESLMTLTLIEL